MPTILTETGASQAKHTIQATVFAAHPALGSICLDVVVTNNAQPIGQRIRNLVTERLGEEWTVFSWNTTGDEF